MSEYLCSPRPSWYEEPEEHEENGLNNEVDFEDEVNQTELQRVQCDQIRRMCLSLIGEQP